MKESLTKHREWRGKLCVRSKIKLDDADSLSLAYTPGVAAPCLTIKDDPELCYDLTGKWNSVAVITDGSAVLGLGNIGPKAAMPVMEGKCALFNEFAKIDAVPICLKTQDTDKIIETVYNISPSFGGINLEDISAPRCFEIERRLKELCDIPVFHDDQHGTAIVVAAALENAFKLVKKHKQTAHIVINGAGSAGIAIAEFLIAEGCKDIILCDKTGILQSDGESFNDAQKTIASKTNPRKIEGLLKDALAGADAFIGVSRGNVLTEEAVRSMNNNAVVFAMANPVPEIEPELAKRAGAAVVATGRSDLPNQINNVLAFPGIFRGALDARAKDITDEMMRAAAHALAQLVDESELSADYIIPKPLDKRVVPAVSQAVMRAVHNSRI